MSSPLPQSNELLQQALKHHQAGQLMQAETIYRQILAVNPKNFDALRLLGVIHAQRKELEPAARTLHEAIAIEPRHPVAHFNYANVLRDLGRFDEAIAAYDKALTLKGDYLDALNSRGNLLLDLKRYDEALTSYDRAIRIKGEHHGLLNNRGNALKAIGRYEEALDAFDRALNAQPDYLEAAYNKANLLLATNRHDEAIAAYSKVLQLKPDLVDALNNRGVAFINTLRFEQALADFDRVLVLRPNNAASFNNRGRALFNLKRYDEALSSYERAIASRGDYAEAWSNRGQALFALERQELALHSLDRALSLAPDSVEAHMQRGNVLKRLNRIDEALAAFNTAQALDPGNAGLHYYRGNLLSLMGRHEEAIGSFDRALAAQPDLIPALNNKADSLAAMLRYEEAIDVYNRALTIHAGREEAKESHVEILNNIGVLLKEMGRKAEALACFERAIGLIPANASSLSNRGVVLVDLNRHAEALACFDEALAVDPNHVETWNNRGLALADLARNEEALQAYLRAIELRPAYAKAHFNASLSLLTLAAFKEGWAEFEWRLRGAFPETQPQSYFASEWNGTDSLEGKTIILRGEQGLGDVVQFSRFIPLVRERGARVIVEVPDALASLIRTVDRDAEYVPYGTVNDGFDYQCALMTLGRCLEIDANALPRSEPYLHAHEGKRAAWRSILSAHGDGLKVGIAWSGNPNHPKDHNRSLRLEELLPLADVEGVTIVSLQTDVREVDKPVLDDAKTIIKVSNDIRDYDDTAALIAQLDLVISCDSSVLHVAGALGVRTWALIPFAPDWRWMLERVDTPWYPSVRLFRQSRIGDWSDVVANVRQSLTELRDLPR